MFVIRSKCTFLSRSTFYTILLDWQHFFSILGHRKSHCQQDGTSQFPFQPNFIRETQRQKLMAGQHVIFLGQSGNDEPISSYHFGKYDLWRSDLIHQRTALQIRFPWPRNGNPQIFSQCQFCLDQRHRSFDSRRSTEIILWKSNYILGRYSWTLKNKISEF